MVSLQSLENTNTPLRRMMNSLYLFNSKHMLIRCEYFMSHKLKKTTGNREIYMCTRVHMQHVRGDEQILIYMHIHSGPDKDV